MFGYKCNTGKKIVLQDKIGRFKVVQKKIKLTTYWLSILFSLTSCCNQESFQIFQRKEYIIETDLKKLYLGR